MSFYLEVVNPEKKLFSGEIKKLILPAKIGQITILTHHVPLFTILKEGKVRITNIKNKVREILIGKGMVEVKKNKVILLVESPEHADRVVKLKADKAKQKAQSVDRKKLIPKGELGNREAFRRSFIDFKDVKRKKRRVNFNFNAQEPYHEAKME